MNELALRQHSPLPYEAGFSLIELIVSITVLTTLLILAAPAFKSLLMNNRILSQKDSLTNSLNYARNVALSQNVNVLVCPLSAPGSTTCGNNWRNGWIVVSTPANGGQTLLESIPSGANDPTVSSVAANGGPAVTSITFDARGIVTTQANFKICDSRGGTFAQSIEVLPTGFVQSGTTVGIAVWDGGAIPCP